MKLARPAVPKRRDDHLVPLINIIFLMLIFFMVVGHIVPAEPFSVEPPHARHGRAADSDDGILLIAADGQLAFDDVVIEAAELADCVSDWLADRSVGQGVAPRTLTVKADAGVRSGQLRQTLDILRAAGVARVTLLTARGS
jgi:biopolymer transport protein ExbD